VFVQQEFNLKEALQMINRCFLDAVFGIFHLYSSLNAAKKTAPLNPLYHEAILCKLKKFFVCPLSIQLFLLQFREQFLFICATQAKPETKNEILNDCDQKQISCFLINKNLT
jgi:hypothetical protein